MLSFRYKNSLDPSKPKLDPLNLRQKTIIYQREEQLDAEFERRLRVHQSRSPAQCKHNSRHRKQQKTVKKEEESHQRQATNILQYLQSVRSRCLGNDVLRKQIRLTLKDQPEVYRLLMEGRAGELRLKKYELLELHHKLEQIYLNFWRGEYQQLFKGVRMNMSQLRRASTLLPAQKLSQESLQGSRVTQLLERNRCLVSQYFGRARELIQVRQMFDKHLDRIKQAG